ncbi:protein phosphatase-7, putative [Entamoeba invadens IP1]|uniref:Serine/threonine-protein phosphatase n=1 Tax=Entamoeba invadens IP1 TaxID=370355 RepID=A0A0A1TUJ9_ENTIV|nr:protein phosphatase-7, putative [Entamoeba invadens IP1]ELP83725.1 protein phosphatase-7, putative [Entamoeba invadens IP1]|eukprot:XP_004183071.1 protein phosphatase-7, putative [Entamoeba invadens IP1]
MELDEVDNLEVSSAQNIISAICRNDEIYRATNFQFLKRVFERAIAILRPRPNVEVIQTDPKSGRVFILVGDLHGQFSDLMTIFNKHGPPCQKTTYILLGDYVDRGNDGLEILLVMCLWKIVCPEYIHFLRGNHESLSTCDLYGFKDEIREKYKEGAEDVITLCGELFKSLQLAAVIGKTAFCVHAGIFSTNQLLQIGDIKDINNINRFVDEDKNEISIFNQLLWSDPELSDGFKKNEFRGIGIVWGSKQSSAFLKKNGLKYIVRSHESPEARWTRVNFRLGGMTDGYVQDHCTIEGGTYTIFSAPCPQVCVQGMMQPCRGAVAVFLPPYNRIVFEQFE